MQPTEKSKYKALLTEQIESITQWNELFKNSKDVAVKKFMSAIGSLYLDYYQFHLDEAKACALEYKPILESSISPVINYIIWLEHRLRSADAMEEPWEIACKGRTNIEAFNAMFGDWVERVDDGGIEEYMQERKGAVYGDCEIPKNMPITHWWWFEDYLNY